jgi:hypothetical protein
VLGVRRSGTTLLRVMLDRHSQLAIPDESYFVPQIADRHRDPIDPAAFVDDLRRLPTIREWGIDPARVRARLGPNASVGAGIAAVYEEYAAARGKQRWGDKTPMYMKHLELLERLFPDALFVHLIRDGRDAALSFLQVPRGIMTESWGHPRDASGFAREWRTEVEGARALGRRVGPSRYLEVRYEELVAAPEARLAAICAFAGLPFEPAMLDYRESLDLSRKPHQQSLAKPPTPGLRRWASQMTPQDVVAFEQVAGDVLAGLGYPTSSAAPPAAKTRASLAAYRLETAAWRCAGRAVRRSPLWARRHPPLV